MIPIQKTKVVQAIAPGAIVDNASWTFNEIDTLGYDYLTVYFNIGATDIAIAALQLTESDTSGSGHANITGATFSTLPSATDDNEVWAIELDLRGRKRYIDATVTAGNGTNGTYMSALAVLSRSGGNTESATERGLGGLKQL